MKKERILAGFICFILLLNSEFISFAAQPGNSMEVSSFKEIFVSAEAKEEVPEEEFVADRETESVESEVMETESVESEVMETESVESEVMETESVESEMIETESVESEMIEAESLEPERIEKESSESGFLETENRTMENNPEAEETVREKLLEKLEEKDIYAIVYMTESYSVKKMPEHQADTVTELKSADTVRIRDFAVEWIEEYGELVPEIWFQVEFYIGENLQQGYIQEQYLVSSDELLKAWKQEFLQIFELDEMTAFAETVGTKDVEQFPYSYQVLLKELKKKHPNWVFVPMNVNRDWNACVTEQLGDYSWIYYNQPEKFRGAKINSTWYYASKEGIAYYMDPRNFLTESDIFMFEQNTYNASYHSLNALQKFLNNTFMKGIIPDDNKKRTYAEIIFNSGKTRGLSPFNLAARIIQEQGVNGNSQMISGKYPGYEGYYNFYNIGASGSSNTEVYKNGLSYAREKGWNTRVKSLNGGAAFIGTGYILKGQDTLYLQKFDLEKKSGYLHQYMQNIMAPYTEGRSMRSMYQNAGSINSDFVFKIPVFLNMANNPLHKISLTETEAELFVIPDGVNKIPVMKEDGTTGEKYVSGLRKNIEVDVIYEPEDTSDDKTVTWKVADESIVSVVSANKNNSHATITAVKGGSTTVTAKVGSLKAKMKVTVHEPMLEAEIEQKEVTIYQGQQIKIPVSYSPITTTDNSEVQWWCDEQKPTDSTDENVVNVENGNICAISVGTAKVHAKIGPFDGTQTELTCVVNVKPYKITFKSASEGVKDQVFENGIYGLKLSEIEKKSGVDFPWEQTETGYVFLGWYSKEGGKGIEVTPDTMISGNLTAYPYFEKNTEEFFVKPVGDKQYTGARIKPVIQVYDGNRKLLVEGKDYKVSYQNNTNVSITNNNKPVITVTGIGNYKKVKELYFDILPGDITESTVFVSELLLSYNGRLQKASPYVRDESRTLQKEKDYTLEFPERKTGAYLEAGVYPVKIIGKGNYTGERTTYITITKKRLISEAVLDYIKEVSYRGGAECIPKIRLSYGSEQLQENVDFTVRYFDHTEIGTAGAIITGMGKYAGSRTEKFKILGADISKTLVSGIRDMEYTGAEVKQDEYVVKDSSGKVLKENTDYTVSYLENVQAGVAKIVFTGIGSYEGQIRKEFRIQPYDIAKEGTKFKVSEITKSMTYDKSGVKPKVTVAFGGKTLKKNTDYTLLYRNNENISSDDNQPMVIVVGKGNFAGQVIREFGIVQKQISEILITAKNITFKNKKSFCFAQPVLKEKNSGRILTKGKDYSTEYVYTYNAAANLWDGTKRKAGEIVEVNDIPLAGTVIKVTVTGSGNYKGTISCTYKIENTSQELQEELNLTEEKNLTIAYTEDTKFTQNPIAAEKVEVMESVQETKNAETKGSEQKTGNAETKESVQETGNAETKKSVRKTENAETKESVQKTENVEIKESVQETGNAETKESEQEKGSAEVMEFAQEAGDSKRIETSLGENVEPETTEGYTAEYATTETGTKQDVKDGVKKEEKLKMLEDFQLLGCAICATCVMIIWRKRKKEE